MGTRRMAVFASVIVLVVIAQTPVTSHAQTRGNTITQSYQFNFQTQGQSMWGPGDAPANIDYRYTLWDVSWDTGQQSAGDVVEVVDWDFGGRIRGSTGGATGLAIRLHNVETGAIDLVYPVDIVLTLPEPNSFRDGETVTIGSAYTLGPGWALNTTPPALDITFEGTFGFQASAGVDVCLFGCTGFPLIPTINIPNSTFEVMRISGNDGTVSMPAIPGASVNTLPHTFTFVESNFHGIGGTVDRPRVITSGSVLPDGLGLQASGSHTYINISVDWDSYTTKVTGISLGEDTPDIGGASAYYNILDFSSFVSLTESKVFEFLPELRLRAVLPVTVEYAVRDAAGNIVENGTSNVFDFAVGQSVDVLMPLGRKDPLEHIPTYTLRNTFTSNTTGELRHDFVMTVLELGLTVPSVTVVPEICDPTGVLGCTPEVNSPRIDLDLGPLYQSTLASQTVPLSAYPTGSWELLGIPSMTGDPFLLDPENPIVTVETDLNSSVLENTGPPGTLTQTIRVSNAGDVRLSNVTLADALQWALWYEDGGPFYIPVDHAGEVPARFVVSSISSDHLTLVDDFDGSSILDRTTLATGNDVLEVGQTATIKIVMTLLHDRLYGADLSTSGISPIGTSVSATNWGTLGVFKMDIDACRLPIRWRRAVTGYLAGTHLLDVEDVDPTSLRIEGVAPTEVEIYGRGDRGRIWFAFEQDILLDSLRSRWRQMNTVVAAPILAMQRGEALPAEMISAVDVADQLLGGTATLNRAQVDALDELGNRNGQLDLGDLRALLVAQQALLDPSGEGGRDLIRSVNEEGQTDAVNLSRRSRGRGYCHPRSGYVSVPAVITGQFSDGTRFVGEDLVNILEEG